MKFSQFIKKLLSGIKKASVVVIQVDTEQPEGQFFAGLMQQVRALCEQGDDTRQHEKVTLTKKEGAGELKNRFQTTFLGKSTVFWVDTCVLPEKERFVWLRYFQSYAGPHTFVLMAQELKPGPAWQTIRLSGSVTKEQFVELCLFFTDMSAEQCEPFAQQVCAQLGALRLDQAWLVMQYMVHVGSQHSAEFFAYWLHKLVINQRSLFTLSELFLCKKEDQFFQYWHETKDVYSQPFWLSFWSDQLWRSYLYANCMKQGKVTQAKKAAFRLPYRFVQYGWKFTDTAALIDTHDLLCDIDYRCKTGGSCLFELMFLNFFVA